MEYFITCSLEQSTLRHSHFKKSMDYAPDHIMDHDAAHAHSPWQTLFDHLLLFAAKCGWHNVLKIKDKIDPEKNKYVLCYFDSFLTHCPLKDFLIALLSTLELYIVWGPRQIKDKAARRSTCYFIKVFLL